MDGLIDARTDGQMDGWTDVGWMDGRTDGWTDKCYGHQALTFVYHAVLDRWTGE